MTSSCTGKSGQLRVATLNTWATRGDWERRLPVLQNGFAELSADIVTLQETVLTDRIDQAAQILGAGYYLAQQQVREPGGESVPAGQGATTASRWPLGQVLEVDLDVTERTGDFAATCLITEVLAPEPYGQIWVANHLPDYQLDHERERRLQTATAARVIESLVTEAPGHVIVAGDLDADPAAASIRSWTGRHVIDDLSVCYRDTSEVAGSVGAGLDTYVPSNPYQADPDWPFGSIDHVLVRCAGNGPTLLARRYQRVFDDHVTTVSAHYGLIVDLEPAAPSAASTVVEGGK